MCLIPLINIFYSVLNNSSRGVHSLVTSLDKSIPMIQVFVIPYILWTPFIFLCFVMLCLKNKKIYYRTLLSLLFGLIACYIVYYVFQTEVPRPVIYGKSPLTYLLNIVYKLDNPFNCFPSIHVLTCAIVMRGYSKCKNINITWKIVVWSICILIILSTQFIKQHVILDVLSAILLGELIYNTVSKLNSEVLLIWPTKLFSSLMMKKKLEI